MARSKLRKYELVGKECLDCKGLKPLSEYYLHKSGAAIGLPVSRCKQCSSKHSKAKRVPRPRRPATIHRIATEGKICPKCKITKSQNSFSLKTRGDKKRVNSWCRECVSEYNHKHALRKIQSTYGISIEQYERVLSRQKSVCAICSQPPSGSGKTKRLYIDHCHETGKFRGLLCHKCNFGLGQFKDNPALLLLAIEYLETSRSKRVA